MAAQVKHWRSWPVAPKYGALSKPQSTAVVRLVRTVRKLAGDDKLKPHADSDTVKFVSKGMRYVAAPIPKCGTKTLKQTFAGPNGVAKDGIEYRGSFEALTRVFPDASQYCVFSFVRNPWARVVSCYRDKIVNSNTLGKVTILSRYSSLWPKMPFELFAEWLASSEGQDEYADRHWLSQNVILGDMCSFIGKIETYPADIEKLAARLGITNIHIYCKNTTSMDSDYRRYYNSKTRAIVAERYAGDIETYEYFY